MDESTETLGTQVTPGEPGSAPESVGQSVTPEVTQQPPQTLDLDKIRKEAMEAATQTARDTARETVEQERRRLQGQYDTKIREINDASERRIAGIRQAMLEGIRGVVPDEDLPRLQENVTLREKAARADAYSEQERYGEMVRQEEQRALDGLRTLGLKRDDIPPDQWGMGLSAGEWLSKVATPIALKRQEEQRLKDIVKVREEAIDAARKEVQAQLRGVESRAEAGVTAVEGTGMGSVPRPTVEAMQRELDKLLDNPEVRDPVKAKAWQKRVDDLHAGMMKAG